MCYYDGYFHLLINLAFFSSYYKHVKTNNFTNISNVQAFEDYYGRDTFYGDNVNGIFQINGKIYCLLITDADAYVLIGENDGFNAWTNGGRDLIDYNSNYSCFVYNACAYNNNIYMCWEYSNYAAAVYYSARTLYNVDTKEVRKLNNGIKRASVLFCNNNYIYEYDEYSIIFSKRNMLNDTITTISNSFSIQINSIIYYNNNLYIFGGNSKVYIYNEPNNTLIEVGQTVGSVRASIIHDNNIYYITGSSIYKYNPINLEANNLLLMASSSGYNINILSNDDIEYQTTINDAIFCDNNYKTDSEMYYGNGTQWIKFKN